MAYVLHWSQEKVLSRWRLSERAICGRGPSLLTWYHYHLGSLPQSKSVVSIGPLWVSASQKQPHFSSTLSLRRHTQKEVILRFPVRGGVRTQGNPRNESKQCQPPVLSTASVSLIMTTITFPPSSGKEESLWDFVKHSASCVDLEGVRISQGPREKATISHSYLPHVSRRPCFLVDRCKNHLSLCQEEQHHWLSYWTISTCLRDAMPSLGLSRGLGGPCTAHSCFCPDLTLGY